MACSSDSTNCGLDENTKSLQVRGSKSIPDSVDHDKPPHLIGDIIDEIKNATNAAKSRLTEDHHDIRKRQDSTSTTTSTHTHSDITTTSQTVSTSTIPQATATSTATSTSTISTSTVLQTVTATGSPNVGVHLIGSGGGDATTAVSVASWVTCIYLTTMVWRLMRYGN
ncbi:hypothetical protein ABW20_dc0100499 [Dactylellina cionopaga]|nr:hypothetical protein ABW20_dc0100499 [Dactylellina cionopaga]